MLFNKSKMPVENREDVNPGVRESLRINLIELRNLYAKFAEQDSKMVEYLIHILQKTHHPKRTVTINDIVSIVFDGTLNLPKTKAEIVKEAERNKNNKPEIAPEIIDIMRNLPDKRFNDQADLAHAIQTTTAS
jgi:hypothetical protein